MSVAIPRSPFNRRTGNLFVALFALASITHADIKNPTDCPAHLRTPHNYIESRKEFTCYDHFQERIFQLAGCPIAFTYTGYISAARLSQQLQQGEIDFLIGLSKTPDRETFLRFSIPFGETRLRLFSLANDSRWNTSRQWCDSTMKRARIIVPLNGYFGPQIEQLRRDKNCAAEVLFYKDSFAAAVGMLQRNRGDIFMMADEAYLRMDKSQQPLVQALPVVIWRDAIHFAFRQDRVEQSFIDRINATIEHDLNKNGAPCGLSVPDAKSSP